MPDDQRLSLQQIADSMSLSLATVRVWVHDKRLPAEKIRHRWMVRRGDLERFLADNPNLGHPKSAAGKAAVAAVDAVPEDWSEQPEEAMTDLAKMRLAPWEPAGARALVPPSQAVEQIREADVQWKAALGGLASLPERLRTLAEAAEEESRALTLAHLANVSWKPRPGASKLSFPHEVRPASGRPGPPATWSQFDDAVKQLGLALEGERMKQLAEAFDRLASIAGELADALTDDELSEDRRQAG
jgi:excisionase family DNA binding protein